MAGHRQSTTNPAVYAAGDSADTAGMPLTPVAVTEGKVAASNMLKAATVVPDYTGVPTTVFTLPELARVGLLEQEAHDQGPHVDVRYPTPAAGTPTTASGRPPPPSRSSSTARPTTSSAPTGSDPWRPPARILGAHRLGPGYAELVNTLALAMRLGLTTRQLKSATTAYPTVGSDLTSML